MFDVIAMGELLIDFTPAGYSEKGEMLFERNPGGAPANVLSAVAKLGGKCAFIGKVGKDIFGDYLSKVLLDNDIDNSGLKFNESINTTLAFVQLGENGERDFSFYRKPGADTTINSNEINLELINNTKIFHFGSLSMTNEPAKSATLKTIEYAKKMGKIISYDPNWRPLLWENESSAKQGMQLGLKYADILKVSEEELEFLTGEKKIEAGADILYKGGIELIFVTLGDKGCYYKYTNGSGFVPAFKVKAIDTTGAGDSFMGSIIYSLKDVLIANINNGDMLNIVKKANAVGAICATKRGAINAMPSKQELKVFIETGIVFEV